MLEEVQSTRDEFLHGVDSTFHSQPNQRTLQLEAERANMVVEELTKELGQSAMAQEALGGQRKREPKSSGLSALKLPLAGGREQRNKAPGSSRGLAGGGSLRRLGTAAVCSMSEDA